MQIVFETRFSYYGVSGWRSRASADPSILFAPDRLERRFALFERITLPSLATQSDPDFRLLVLTSSLMPPPWRQRLNDLAHDILGAGRVKVMAKPPRVAGKIFRRAVIEDYPDAGAIAQVVLDDDDAVSCDFVANCRSEAQQCIETLPSQACFLSFPEGCSLLFEDGQPRSLSTRHAPFTNLGLTLVGPPESRPHLFMTSHRQVGTRFASRLIECGRPFYLRSVHDDNDSRALHDKTALGGADLARTLRYFPFLANDLGAVAGAVGIAAE